MMHAKHGLVLASAFLVFVVIAVLCVPASGQHVHFGDYPERYFTDPDAVAVACVITEGDAAALDDLIAAGASVDAEGHHDVNLLTWCMTVTNKPAFVRLLKAGADPKRRLGSRWDSALVRAVKERTDYYWLEHMLDAGVDANSRIPGGSVPILLYAAEREDDGWLRLLIDRGADLNARDTKWGQTAAIYAAMIGQFEVVAMLLDAGADFSAHDDDNLDVAYATVRSRIGPDHAQWRARERVLDRLKARGVDLTVAAERAKSHGTLDTNWWALEVRRPPGKSLAQVSPAPPPVPVAPRLDICVTPYYDSRRPEITVGKFSGRLCARTKRLFFRPRH